MTTYKILGGLRVALTRALGVRAIDHVFRYLQRLGRRGLAHVRD
jgi:hypothetical protein